jgi:CRP/FNR family cyclic AMP-dependent transcriptional regulator
MMAVFTRMQREWSINDVARLVRRHERFKMLSEADSVTLVQHMHPVRLDAGKVLFREGRADTSGETSFMAIILEGEARAESEGGGVGAKIKLGDLKEGDVVGEQGIIHETPRTATVTAKTDMMLAAIDSGKFDKLIKSKPALGCEIMLSMLRTVTDRLYDLNQRVYVLEDSNIKLKEELRLEKSAARARTELKDIPPLQFTQTMFEPPPEKK